MQLVTAPRNFDVILTGNLFGDILSDVATATAGHDIRLVGTREMGDAVVAAVARRLSR
jgi:3-isopropylmalate dehydrogenase